MLGVLHDESWFLKWRIARGDRVIRNVRPMKLPTISNDTIRQSFAAFDSDLHWLFRRRPQG
ncbi:hypothetical protein RBSWK_03725 [Rhodopirellula baltica SWK14]|uniref:Uncharacterized protein n=1 Tax=Rhodopirellula baltica SWK14 TaxID=993516 RepID=L7CDP4_RHOBT|nr:hypothetical protein RBSWK_03725 [Rhodopirellula baltica SWK14]